MERGLGAYVEALRGAGVEAEIEAGSIVILLGAEVRAVIEEWRGEFAGRVEWNAPTGWELHEPIGIVASRLAGPSSGKPCPPNGLAQWVAAWLRDVDADAVAEGGASDLDRELDLDLLLLLDEDDDD
jgi:hypothetical protein